MTIYKTKVTYNRPFKLRFFGTDATAVVHNDGVMMIETKVGFFKMNPAEFYVCDEMLPAMDGPWELRYCD